MPAARRARRERRSLTSILPCEKSQLPASSAAQALVAAALEKTLASSSTRSWRLTACSERKSPGAEVDKITHVEPGGGDSLALTDPLVQTFILEGSSCNVPVVFERNILVGEGKRFPLDPRQRP
eukprot:754768-Hanusia_phi.AAC.2